MDPDLARELVDAGQLPTLRELWSTAAWSRTVNPEGFVVGSVWPSLWSGQWPSRHGYYSTRQIVNGTYEVGWCQPKDITSAPFWAPIARAGHPVHVIDVPLAPLCREDQCIQISEWGGHDRIVGRGSVPPDAYSELEQGVGAYAMTAECDIYADREEWCALRDDLVAGVQQHTNAAKLAWGENDTELVISVYAESHCAGHNLWGQRELFRDVYRAVDAGVGELLAATGPDDVVVVLLSHGIGSPFGYDHLLGEILRRLDDAYGAPSPLVAARERVLRPLERRLHERRRRRSLATTDARSVSLVSVDSARRFYRLPSIGLHGYVRFNVVGREPRGRVRPGGELDDLASELAADLRALIDPHTGEPVVADVVRTADRYAGERLDNLPDLLLEWNPDAGGHAASSERIGEVSGAPIPYRAGEHRASGTIFVRGPGIAPGALPEPVRCVDLGPTIAAMFGLDRIDTDGTVIDRLVPAAAP
jgi:predicted AlkP superfamily phosphohydrolase/phosphomutase